MSFNFKEAFEDLKTLQTPEGKAEEFLRSTIRKLKEQSLNELDRIESFSFEIYGSGDPKSPCDYKLFAYYNYTASSMSRSQSICFSPPFGDKEEIFSVYNAVKSILEKSYKLEETPVHFGGNTFYHFVQGFHFKVL